MDFIHLALYMASTMKGRKDEQYTPEETARRRDEAIRRALNTPPKPQSEIIGRSGRKPKERTASKGRVHKGKARN
jgi:hypothetical protein